VFKKIETIFKYRRMHPTTTMAQSQHKINWGDDEETFQAKNTTLTAIQLWNLFHVTPRKCDIVGREREEGEVDDDEYNHD
jgi:hypothetical protein